MTEPAPSAPPSASIWEDIIDVFYMPREVFARRRAAGFGVALTILVVAALALSFGERSLQSAVADAEWHRATQQMTKQMSGDQMQTVAVVFNKTKEVGLVTGPPFKMLFVVITTAALTWIGALVLGVKLSFRACMMISTYSAFPRLLEQVANAIQGYLVPLDSITSRYQVTFSLARFADVDHLAPGLVAALGRCDVFIIWNMILLSIGVATVVPTSKARGREVAGFVWVVGVALALVQAMRTGM